MSPQQSPPQTPPQNPKPKQLKGEAREKVLRKVYFDILEGFTAVNIDGKSAWIKHFDLKSQTKIDEYYKETYDKARANGLMTREELLAHLEAEGTWSAEEEGLLQDLIKNREGLETSYSKALNSKMQEVIESNIARLEKEIKKTEKKKSSLISNTCEQFADRRSSDMIVQLSFYKTDKSSLYFSNHEFDLLDRQDIASLVGVYNTATEELTVESIKQIAISDFFTSYYSLVEDSPSQFFGESIHKLTFFQINLLNYAKLFSSILKNLDAPEHIRGNAEKLLAFAKSEGEKRKSEQRKADQRKGGPATLS